ncbi:beta-mannosidase [Celeribacter neptunius]|uniref:beta-mannosidase n=1 Tax=Celeribacter neptunius TaxID=588602 RepID=A0A1I3LUR3_9RHOB|nr:glycoside hydrolase family 2 protein [Celeribacter neptunius]SFI88280.1 beta-mannosidase [Celeribacter neptunius]
MSVELNQGWGFADAAGEHAVMLDLPFDSVSALFEAGISPEPYAGRNAEALRWIAERDWLLSRTVVLEDIAVELVAVGLDGVVDVLVNGQHLLTADNAFRTWRIDLSEVARIGENEISLRFRSVIREAQARQDAQPRYVPYHKGNCPIPNINMLRKPQCDFGWDWNPALAPFGVTGGLRIAPRAAPRIAHLRVDQEHHDIESESVSLTVTAQFENVPDGTQVDMRFADRSRQTEVLGGRAEAKFFVEIPEFWWPAGQGAQPLYDLDVTCAGATAHRRIGLRRIEHLTLKDDQGTGFKFRVNGRDVFAKGANWIPAEALSGRISRDKVRDLLQSAVEAHMNMIRVWGGGRYDPDWFYDLCDELGLMVWQDFMFACNLYPTDDAFIANVAEEVREQVERLSHHACLALWCGDNEIIGMLEEFPEAKANRDHHLVAYDRLNRHIENTLKAIDPKANWWPSSPSLGAMDFGDAWHDDSSGDMHVWSVWHENKPFAAYRDVAPRFVSEFGFQSFPSLPLIDDYLGDRNLSSPAMDSHQKNVGGNARIIATMMREFRLPERMEDLVYLSQLQQGLALKTAISAWRAQKGRCWGTLYWQLNDTWPCASWSTLDYGGGWKLSHHMAQRFYAPIFVAVVPGESGDSFKIINDFGENIDVTVQVAAVNMAGAARPLADAVISAWPSKALELFELPAGTLREDEIYVYTWQYDGPEGVAGGGDFHCPRPWKENDLMNPGIDMNIKEKDGVFDVTLEAGALALFVTLEADQPGRFSGNAISLLPGLPAKITFTPDQTDTPVNFSIRDLYSACYGGQK